MYIYIYNLSGNGQCISLPSSFLSLAFANLKLYFFLRLGRYQDVDPTWKLKLMFPIFALQLLFLLVPIVVIAAYLREWMVLYIPIHITLTGLFLRAFVNLNDDVEKHYKKRFTDKITEQDREKGLNEAWNIFFVACCTAWIAPGAVWDKKSRFLQVTSLNRNTLGSRYTDCSKLLVRITRSVRKKVVHIANHYLEGSARITRPHKTY